jgi:hypothetical protein
MKFEMESPNNHGSEKCNPLTVERLGIRTKKPNRLSWAINKNYMPFHSFYYRVEPSEAVSLHIRTSMEWFGVAV